MQGDTLAFHTRAFLQNLEQQMDGFRRQNHLRNPSILWVDEEMANTPGFSCGSLSKKLGILHTKGLGHSGYDNPRKARREELGEQYELETKGYPDSVGCTQKSLPADRH